jgi:hypothetical protein
MRGGIVEAKIGFDLDDAAAEPLASAAMDQDFTEEVARDDVRRAQVEIGREHRKW